MASFFGHAVAALAIGKTYRDSNFGFLSLCVICSILPDADVIGFVFDVPYESFWGHRGFTHSILFALLLSAGLTFAFYRNKGIKKILWAFVLLFLSTISHALLDAMTTGGLGVAFFSPFDETRYFLSFRPIQVSPIGIDRFLGEWGIRVLKSEAIYIGIPSFIYVIFLKLFRSKVLKRDVG